VAGGGLKIVRALYGAVRDKNWDTVPFELVKLAFL
jgi:hypothetical protein